MLPSMGHFSSKGHACMCTEEDYMVFLQIHRVKQVPLLKDTGQGGGDQKALSLSDLHP